MLDQIKKLQPERRLYYQALIDHRDFPYIVSTGSTALILTAPGLYCKCVGGVGWGVSVCVWVGACVGVGVGVHVHVCM